MIVADEVVDKVSLVFATQGYETVIKHLRKVQEITDELAANKQISAFDQAKMSKGVADAEKALKRLDGQSKKNVEGFNELIKTANKASKEMRAAAQTAVVGGSVTPVADLGVSVQEAKELAAIRKAQSLTDRQVAAEVLANAKRQETLERRAAEQRIKDAQRVADAEKRLAQSQGANAYAKDVAGLSGVEKATKDVARASSLLADAEREVKAARAANNPAAITTALNNQTRAVQNLTRAENALARAQLGGGVATQSMADHLPRLRYALYDVSTTFAFAGAAMLGLGVAAAGTAITMDRQFADVIRTAGTYTDKTGESTDRLRDSFDNLFSTLPANWGTLTQIGTLAGQLGVAAENADEFTSLIVKMVTTTDLSAEQAATSMARLAELLDVSAGQYENLGSSILATGTASIATETQITRTATEIASMGDFAGFSADQVIGLSSALASLGVQPELARGIITRLFTNISVAIANGGDRLEAFGQIAGTTGQQFAQAWGTDAAGALQQLLTGLGQLEGTEATTTLQDLGITASRDIPTILKLAQNHKLLADQMQIASDGFDQGTALQEQYGVVAQTVAEKLNVLKNNVQLLISELGSAGSALGPVVDVLTTMVRGLTEISNNSVAKGVITVTLTLTALSGVLAILAGGAARGAASMFALRTSLLEAGAAGYTAKTGMDAATASSWALATSIKGVKLALITTGIGAAFVAIGSAIAYFVGKADEAKTSSEALKSAFAEAVEADTRAGEGVRKVTVNLANYRDTADTVSLSQEAWNRVLDGSSTYADEFAKAVAGVKGEVDGLNVSIGEATIAQFLKMFTENPDLQQSFALGLLPSELDFQKLAQAWGSGGAAAADAYIEAIYRPEDLRAAIAKQETIVKEAEQRYLAASAGMVDQEEIAALPETTAFNEQSDALAVLNGRLRDYETVKRVAGSGNQAFVDASEEAAFALRVQGDAATDAGGATRDLADEMRVALEALTDVQSQMLNTESALASLGKGLQDGGLEWSQYTDAGRENLQNLMSVMEAMAKENEGNPLALAADYQALFQTLVNGGYASEKQLVILQQAIQSLLGQAGVKSVAASGKDFTSFFNGWASGADKAGRSTRKAAKEVRTLVDYANDLSKVWSRAFDIQFGPVSTMDAITSTFQDLRDAADEAARKVSGLKTEISGLETDLATQKYFLSIATLYNDDNRAREIQQNILELEEKLTDKKRELTDEQDAQSKALVGNTKAAIANRKTVMGLIQDYQDHVKALAASGMSAGQLSIAVDQLKSDFMSQATALGFSESELQNYVRALDGMKVAINGVPRNITVGASIDPAIQALNEFQAQYEKMRGDISSSPVNIPVNNVDYNKSARGTALYAEMMSLRKGIEQGVFNYGPALNQSVQRIRDIVKILASGNYWTGGFTGRGGMYDYAGAVHKGEYVIPKRDVNQSTGLPKAEALSRLSRGVPGRTGYAEGGFVTGLPGRLVVDLSGSSLQHLAGLVSKKLVIDGQVLGRTVNRSYESSARMGSN